MADATPILMLSLLDSGDAATLDADFVAAPMPTDAFASAYGPFVESLAFLPLLLDAEDAPLRIAG